jgi:F-type H+-transporting ATPase subunit b
MTPETQSLAADAVNTAVNSGLLGTFGLNGKLFLAQLLNFGVVVFIVWRWVYRPLVKLIDERSKKINDGLEFSKEAANQLEEISIQKKEVLKQAKAESLKLIEEAGTAAEAVKREKLDETKKEVDRMVEEGKSRIENERQSSYEALKGDIANLVTSATKKVLQGLDDKAQHDLIKSAVNDLEKE